MVPKVPLGRINATRDAMEWIPSWEIEEALARHARCDWGDLCPEDWAQNERALVDGARLVSAYHSKAGTNFWIITEAGRSKTTVLLPEDH